MQGYIFWPFSSTPGGGIFSPNWKTGKNLKEDFKIPLWSLNDRKKIHKNREEFQEWGGGIFFIQMEKQRRIWRRTLKYLYED